ncbi:MAG TPA: nickel-binding protein [Gaiellaceae bacterium]
MKLYAIRRRGGWTSPEGVQATAAKSLQVGDEEMSDDIRWIRSYVLHEPDGSLGTVCIYEASSPEKIREHAFRSDMPATEIFEVADTVIVRPDPVPAAA